MSWLLLILLLSAGLLFIAVEILFAPGFTIFGVVGGISLFIGIFYSFLYLPLQYSLIILFVSLFLVASLLYWFFTTGIKKRIGLKERESNTLGFRPFKRNYQLYIGKTGIAVSPLRPAGKIEIENDIISAVSEGDFIEKDEKIMVVKIEGNKIVVQKIKS